MKVNGINIAHIISDDARLNKKMDKVNKETKECVTFILSVTEVTTVLHDDAFVKVVNDIELEVRKWNALLEQI